MKLRELTSGDRTSENIPKDGDEVRSLTKSMNMSDH